MHRSSTIIAAATCSGLLALGLVVAPAASAYPPGTQQQTELNKTEIREGGRFKAVVENARPGCTATIHIINKNGRIVTSRSGTVNKNGRLTREFSGDTPTRPGTYTVTTRISGTGCGRPSSSATLTVR